MWVCAGLAVFGAATLLMGEITWGMDLPRKMHELQKNRYIFTCGFEGKVYGVNKNGRRRPSEFGRGGAAMNDDFHF